MPSKHRRGDLRLRHAPPAVLAQLGCVCALSVNPTVVHTVSGMSDEGSPPVGDGAGGDGQPKATFWDVFRASVSSSKQEYRHSAHSFIRQPCFRESMSWGLGIGALFSAHRFKQDSTCGVCCAAFCCPPRRWRRADDKPMLVGVQTRSPGCIAHACTSPPCLELVLNVAYDRLGWVLVRVMRCCVCCSAGGN